MVNTFFNNIQRISGSATFSDLKSHFAYTDNWFTFGERTIFLLNYDLYIEIHGDNH